MNPTVISPIPLIQYTEQRLTKIRDRLESMFHRLLVIHDVIVVNAKALESQNTDLDSEMARVLRRCGSDKLRGQLQSLNHIIEQFGGTTEFTGHRWTSEQQGEMSHAAN